MDEIWSPIKNYEDIYIISNYGRVKSLDRIVMTGNQKNLRYGRILKPALDGKGYLHVILQHNKHKECKKLHKLVAETFISNPDRLPCINHIDRNKLNNRSDNLEWCTNQYNCEYSSAKNYIFISPLGEIIKVFNLNKFCKEHNLTNSNMLKVLKGLRGHHKGWTCPNL